MSNIMQYLIQISDEFRDSYSQVDARIDEIQEELKILKLQIDTIEYNTHPNRQSEYEREE